MNPFGRTTDGTMKHHKTSLTFHLYEVQLFDGPQYWLVLQGEIEFMWYSWRGHNVLVPGDIRISDPRYEHGANLSTEYINTNSRICWRLSTPNYIQKQLYALLVKKEHLHGSGVLQRKLTNTRTLKYTKVHNRVQSSPHVWTFSLASWFHQTISYTFSLRSCDRASYQISL